MSDWNCCRGRLFDWGVRFSSTEVTDGLYGLRRTMKGVVQRAQPAGPVT